MKFINSSNILQKCIFATLPRTSYGTSWTCIKPANFVSWITDKASQICNCDCNFAYTYNLDAKQSEWNNGNIQCYFDAIIHKWMNTNGLYIPACPHKYLMCTSTLHWECLWALRRTLPAQLQTGDWSNFFTVQNKFTLELQHLKNWCQVGKHPHRLEQCWYYGWEVSAHMKLK